MAWSRPGNKPLSESMMVSLLTHVCVTRPQWVNICILHLIPCTWEQWLCFNSSPPWQNGRHTTDKIFRCIFLNEKFCIMIKISLKFVPKGPIDNKSALAQVMAWRRTGNKPLPEPMHIRSTRGGWVNVLFLFLVCFPRKIRFAAIHIFPWCFK